MASVGRADKWDPEDAATSVTLDCAFNRCRIPDSAHVIASGYDFEYETLAKEIDYLECQLCRAIFPSRVPKVNETHLIYPPNYYSFSESSKTPQIVKRIRQRLHGRRIKSINRHIPLGPLRVLDIGCGDGENLRLWRDLRETVEVFGVDSSHSAIESCARYSISGKVLDLDQSHELYHLGSFDVILLIQVLEHVRNPALVLSDIREITKEDGIVVIETPEPGSLDHRLFRNRYWAGYHMPRHFWIMPRRELVGLLTAGGWDVISVKSLINPVAWIHSIQGVMTEIPILRYTRSWWSHRNPLLLAVFSALEILIKVCGRQTSNLQIVVTPKKTDTNTI